MTVLDRGIGIDDAEAGPPVHRVLPHRLRQEARQRPRHRAGGLPARHRLARGADLGTTARGRRHGGGLRAAAGRGPRRGDMRWRQGDARARCAGADRRGDRDVPLLLRGCRCGGAGRLPGRQRRKWPGSARRRLRPRAGPRGAGLGPWSDLGRALQSGRHARHLDHGQDQADGCRHLCRGAADRGGRRRLRAEEPSSPIRGRRRISARRRSAPASRRRWASGSRRSSPPCWCSRSSGLRWIRVPRRSVAWRSAWPLPPTSWLVDRSPARR